MMPTYAWLTPPAPAAIAVLALDVAPGPLRRWPEPGRVALALLRDRLGQVVDEALCLRLDAQRAELHVHGGPGMRASVTAALSEHGYREGEIPSDAAWSALAQAPAEAPVRALLGGWADRVPPQFLRRCPLVLLTGPANAGKSTLINHCCGHARALVSEVPGTTRDLVAADVVHRGWRMQVLDSAGLRPSEDPLERAGQDLVRAARARADLVVYLHPGDASGPPKHHPGDLVVIGKADLVADAGSGLAWSDRGADVAQARSHVLDAMLARLGLPLGDVGT